MNLSNLEQYNYLNLVLRNEHKIPQIPYFTEVLITEFRWCFFLSNHKNIKSRVQNCRNKKAVYFKICEEASRDLTWISISCVHLRITNQVMQNFKNLILKILFQLLLIKSARFCSLLGKSNKTQAFYQHLYKRSKCRISLNSLHIL